MKKIVIILIILFVNSLASDLNKIKVEIISQISSVIMKKERVKVFVSDRKFLKLKKDTKKIKFVNTCQDADIIVCKDIKNLPKECRNKIILCTRYRSYKRSDSAFGAIFWQKGRPNLIFSAKSIKERGIRLPNSFRKYIDE